MKSKTVLSGALICAFAAFLIGIADVLGPVSYGSGGNNINTFLMINSLIGALFALLLCHIRHISLKVKSGILLQACLISFLGYSLTGYLLNLSFTYIGVGSGSMIHNIYPIFVIISACIINRSLPRKLTVLSVFMVVIGVGMLSLDASGLIVSVTGIVIALLSGLANTISLIMQEKSGITKEPEIKIAFYMALFSAFTFLVYALATDSLAIVHMSLFSFGTNILSGICSHALGLLLIQVGIRRCGSTITSIMAATEPLTGVFLGVLLLHESLSTTKLLGCILVILAISLEPISLLKSPHKIK